jgi:phosphopentomutase
MPSPYTRAIVIVMDSVGVGELPDAAVYGDQGSNTLGNVAARVPLKLANLARLGISCILPLAGVPAVAHPAASFGRMAERAPGKDSVTGHWELTGYTLDRPFPLFPDGFPPTVMRPFEERIGRSTLGNKAASGTAIIDELGPEHMRTGCPIVYTSADSVFQIAAHEEVIPVPELYRMCEAAYDIVVRGLGMGRVIARPFVGQPGSFKRTANRHDFAIPPPAPTLLDLLKQAGLPVVGIGKIEDLFAGHGTTRAIHTKSDEDGMDRLLEVLADTPSGLVFINLVDFDAQYGHRNNVQGYAENLERFDRRLAEVLARLLPTDLLVITADHGNDPTTPSTDHSREYVPLLVTGPRVTAGVDLGVRPTFADLGQTLAEVFSVGPTKDGESFLEMVVGR